MTPELLFKHPIILVAFVALALAEWAWRRRPGGEGYDVQAATGSVGVMVLGFLAKPVSAFVIGGFYLAVSGHVGWSWPVDDWRSWAIGFLAVEFAYYWFHRFSHTVRWLWATHAVHHSAQQFVLPAAIRLGWTGALSGGWLIYLPLVLLGMPPAMLVTLLGANLLYQYLLHTELVKRLGPLESVFNTPSHHRAHHSSDEEFLDCNFGGVLIVFDRLFGTFRREPTQGGLRYGLVHPLESHNPFTIALREWWLIWREVRAARSWEERARILVARPGSHPPDQPELIDAKVTP